MLLFEATMLFKNKYLFCIRNLAFKTSHAKCKRTDNESNLNTNKDRKFISLYLNCFFSKPKLNKEKCLQSRNKNLFKNILRLKVCFEATILIFGSPWRVIV
jgi:hypothetical protein